MLEFTLRERAPHAPRPEGLAQQPRGHRSAQLGDDNRRQHRRAPEERGRPSAAPARDEADHDGDGHEHQHR